MKIKLTKIEKNEIDSLIGSANYHKQYNNIYTKIGDCDSIEKFVKLNIHRMKAINRLKYLLAIIDSNIDIMNMKEALLPKFQEELEYIKKINSHNLKF